jgi:hypothetical protein
VRKAFRFFKRSLATSATSATSQTPKLNATVKRVDNYGHIYTVKTGLSAEEAEKLADEYENKHHHQGYWVEYDENSSVKRPDPDSTPVSKKQ